MTIVSSLDPLLSSLFLSLSVSPSPLSPLPIPFYKSRDKSYRKSQLSDFKVFAKHLTFECVPLPSSLPPPHLHGHKPQRDNHIRQNKWSLFPSKFASSHTAWLRALGLAGHFTPDFSLLTFRWRLWDGNGRRSYTHQTEITDLLRQTYPNRKSCLTYSFYRCGNQGPEELNGLSEIRGGQQIE